MIFVLLCVAIIVVPVLFLTAIVWFSHVRLREKTGAKKKTGPSPPTPPPPAPAPKADKLAGVMVRALLWVGSVVALVVMIVGGVKFSDNKPKPASPQPRPVALTTNAPWEVVEPLFSGCESRDGAPGSGRQFKQEGGKLVVVRGSRKGGNNAVGFDQINIGDPLVVKFLLNNGLSEKDVEESEGDNRRAGKLLYEEFLKTGGTHPWEATRGCWAPLLAQAGYGKGGYTKTMVAPTETFGEIEIPEGYKVKFDWGENTISLVRNEEKPITLGPKDHYKGAGKTKVLKIKSEEGHPLEIKLEFTPI